MSLVADYNHIFNVWQDYHNYQLTYDAIYNWLLKYYNNLESKKDVDDLLSRFSYYRNDTNTIVDDFLSSNQYVELKEEIRNKN